MSNITLSNVGSNSLPQMWETLQTMLSVRYFHSYDAACYHISALTEEARRILRTYRDNILPQLETDHLWPLAYAHINYSVVADSLQGDSWEPCVELYPDGSLTDEQEAQLDRMTEDVVELTYSLADICRQMYRLWTRTLTCSDAEMLKAADFGDDRYPELDSKLDAELRHLGIRDYCREDIWEVLRKMLRHFHDEGLVSHVVLPARDRRWEALQEMPMVKYIVDHDDGCCATTLQCILTLCRHNAADHQYYPSPALTARYAWRYQYDLTYRQCHDLSGVGHVFRRLMALCRQLPTDTDGNTDARPTHCGQAEGHATTKPTEKEIDALSDNNYSQYGNADRLAMMLAAIHLRSPQLLTPGHRDGYLALCQRIASIHELTEQYLVAHTADCHTIYGFNAESFASLLAFMMNDMHCFHPRNNSALLRSIFTDSYLKHHKTSVRNLSGIMTIYKRRFADKREHAALTAALRRTLDTDPPANRPLLLH